MAKLKNLQAIQEMMAGTHKSQNKTAVSFSGTDEKHVKRKIGETWTDSEGKEWEQKDGYKVQNKIQNSAFERPKNCQKESCNFGWHKLDSKYKIIHGTCFDCGVKLEHQMRTDGTWEEYEKGKVRENIKAWLKDAEQEVEDLKAGLSATHEYINEDGTIEKWNTGYDVEKMRKSIDEQFAKTKKELLEIVNEK